MLGWAHRRVFQSPLRDGERKRTELLSRHPNAFSVESGLCSVRLSVRLFVLLQLRSTGDGGGATPHQQQDVIPEKGPRASPPPSAAAGAPPPRRRRMPEVPSIPPNPRLPSAAVSTSQVLCLSADQLLNLRFFISDFERLLSRPFAQAQESVEDWINFINQPL